MPNSAMFPRRRDACETGRKLRIRAPRLAHAFLALCAALVLLGAPARAGAQPPERGVSAEGSNHESGRNGLLDALARIVNFGILAGTLVYLLRSPIGHYLDNRGTQIRRDLVEAAETKQAAAAQIEAIEARMRALPAELEALRAQGAQEVSAEEARIRAAAAAERDRLLAQARREIDLQVKVAERELVAHAADLAVSVATERIKKNITESDQQRLIDRYVEQLRH